MSSSDADAIVPEPDGSVFIGDKGIITTGTVNPVEHDRARGMPAVSRRRMPSEEVVQVHGSQADGPREWPQGPPAQRRSPADIRAGRRSRRFLKRSRIVVVYCRSWW